MYDRNASYEEGEELGDDDGELGAWSSAEDKDMFASDIPMVASKDDE